MRSADCFPIELQPVDAVACEARHLAVRQEVERRGEQHHVLGAQPGDARERSDELDAAHAGQEAVALGHVADELADLPVRFADAVPGEQLVQLRLLDRHLAVDHRLVVSGARAAVDVVQPVVDAHVEQLRRLEGTPYADMARHAREVYEERHSLFDLEAVLDSRYYRAPGYPRSLATALAKLTPESVKAALKRHLKPALLRVVVISPRAKKLAEAHLTAAAAADKGDVFVLAPNDGTARAIADVFAADTDVSSYVVTGQDAEIPSVQYIIDGKQSMTVLKDVRTLVSDAITAAVAYLEGGTPPETATYDNGKIEVPAKPSEVVTVDQSNVKEALIDSGYYDASEFTGLGAAPAAPAQLAAGVVLPTKNEPRWIQDETRFNEAFAEAGYDVQILFSDGDSAKERSNVEALIAQGAGGLPVFVGTMQYSTSELIRRLTHGGTIASPSSLSSS